MYRLGCTFLVAMLTVVGCGSEGPPATSDSRACSALSAPADQSSPETTLSPSVSAPVSDGSNPEAGETAIVLPQTLFLVVGQTFRLEFSSVITGFDDNTEVGVTSTESGSINTAQYWQFTPTRPGTFTLTFTVRDRNGLIRVTASRPVVVYAPRTINRLRHLSIGDSITRAGAFTELAIECILGGRSVGTRTYDSGKTSMEGRGGWTLHQYEGRVAQLVGGDSPFLFPAHVKGSNYLGNTAFWRSVTADDPHGYSYDGFQMMARGWKSNGPYLYDSNGYPVSPKLGNVVVDPTQEPGLRWKKFDGANWLVMNPQPHTELSFSKYVDCYRAAFSGGNPTSISIMLGTVDFLSTPTEIGWADFKQRMDLLIASIREWNADVPIIIIGAPNGAPSDLWKDQKISKYEFDRRMIDNSKRLYAAFDTPEAAANKVYVISFLGVVADDKMSDYVHPKVPEGHAQMAPWLAGILLHLAASGSI